MELVKNQMNSYLLMEMQKEFTQEEQVVFANNFYMYLNYHPTEDFVIDRLAQESTMLLQEKLALLIENSKLDDYIC